MTTTRTNDKTNIRTTDRTDIRTTDRTVCLGIDPGLSGALALIDVMILSGHKQGNPVVAVYDIPLDPEVKGKKRSINWYRLATTIDSHRDVISFAMIEDVGVMTGREGRVSMFNFGKSFGGLIGILAANNLPMYFVKPSVWKSSMGLSRDKNESRKKAAQLFPQVSPLLSRVKDDGRAEALLLGVYGSRTLINQKSLVNG